ncbi:transglycosylase SLT domain-containing protein [Thiocapsa rosea]|uniref:Membrane-bound lytic murein transglycosylase D n=1 Tax=Thiocapsa rosea TaxID=69360 RepID=A0A495V6Y5_9GAMM|nr:transglycosylase SLT domain-containing protein [Thiocapsa rosea]RKT45079.1 membrane-bound lytic murein transglycosylase D [Thiocapsa rosea]
MPDAARFARSLGALGVLSLLLNGCATETRMVDNDFGDSGYSGMVSAREYGFVRPATDVVVMERYTAGRADPRGDLWNRVRTGMSLDLHADARIDSTVERFRRDPQYLSRMSQQGMPYLHMIVTEIERRGLPMELAFLPHVESRFNPVATSPKAAAGIWQFMPYTGLEMGLRQDAWYDGRRDPLASTGAALDYLEQLNRRFDGDWALAMAAYNCGPGRVAAAQAANRRSGKPTDYWSLNNLPNETKQYVPQILATARLVAAPTRYGLNLPPVPDRPQLEVVRTQQPVDLNRVASATGVQLYELQRLNPALKLGRTAPDGPGHILVPAGTGQRIGKKMGQVQIMPARASAAQSRSSAATRSTLARAERHKIHVVKGGETIASIARANGIEPRALAELNGISVREPLLSGQTLKVQATDDSALITHLVTKGDSIKTLAKRYGVSVKDLQRWNRLAETRLNPGDLILIYPPGRAPTS